MVRSTMRKTRKAALLYSEKLEKRRKERESLSPEIRAQRLLITKGVAERIISAQESLNGSKRGCRKNF